MQFIGCDVSKLTLDLAFLDKTNQHWNKPCRVPNTRRGWNTVINTFKPATNDELCIVMEATGVYHLKAAAHLSLVGFKVIIINPGRAAEYARSMNRTNKSDRLDACDLARYGAQLDEPHWYQVEAHEISQLKNLLSRLNQLDKDLRRESNRLEKCDFLNHSQLLAQSIRRSIRFIKLEQTAVQALIDQHITQHPNLKRNQQLMCSIKGIGKKTSQWLLPMLSTQRFNHAREVAAFLGLVPCHRQSGTSLNSKGHLSGRGNAVLRAKLYMPALCASIHDPELKTFYQSLLARGKTPKQALTAVMRKLVHICYGVIKHQTPYQANYVA